MLNSSDYKKYKLNFIVKTFVHQEQFAQWLRKFFYINSALYKEYDTIYQDSFYVVFYELTTEGLLYSKDVLSHLKKEDNKIEWYTTLVTGLEDFRKVFTETEFEYIKYKRHNASHIFQNGYEHQVFEKGKISSAKREDKIEQKEKDFKDLLLKYGSDKNFDIFMHKKLYPLIIDLYDRLQKISSH